MHLGDYTIRHATPIDMPKVKEFYANNTHVYNAARSDDILLASIEHNRKMLILLAPDGSIAGASAVFEHLDGRFREAGATRITANGFQIQRVFHHLRAVHEHVMDSDYEEYFSTVVIGNEKSINNLVGVGFELWASPDADLVHYKSELARRQNRTAPVAYYRLPRERLTGFAAAMLALADNRKLTRFSRTSSGQTETIGLTLDVELVRYHRPVLEQLARGLGVHD